MRDSERWLMSPSEMAQTAPDYQLALITWSATFGLLGCEEEIRTHEAELL